MRQPAIPPAAQTGSPPAAVPDPAEAADEAGPAAFRRHDHGACVAAALAAADAACAARGARLTPLRRRTLEILLEGHAAMGAYEVLARLAAEGRGSQPPVAYRALGFLVAQGLAHRVEALGAFVACARPGAAHAPALTICRACRRVAEGEAVAVAATAGFAVERQVVEAEGLCSACQVGAA